MNRSNPHSMGFGIRAVARATMVALFVTIAARPACAQMRDADPEASKALLAVIEAMRSKPIEVRERVVVSTVDGERRADAAPRTASWTIVPGRGAMAAFDGFRIRLADGVIRTVHESSDGLYHERKDDGSPYYGLLATFSDLPWPALALGLGVLEHAAASGIRRPRPRGAGGSVRSRSAAAWLARLGNPEAQPTGVSRKAAATGG